MLRSTLLATALVLSSGATTLAANPEVEPRADELMHSMSDYLSRLPSFRVHSSVVDELVTDDGQKIQHLSASQLAVRRPNKLRTERVGPVTDVVFRYDGKEFSVYGKRTGYFATAPAPATLDAAIDAARERYSIDAPAADLLFSDPYASLMEGVLSGRYIGTEPIGDDSCHHLAFRGKHTDWQIWIKDGPQPLPIRYVITTKDVPGHPQFETSLTAWEPNASLPDSVFKFDPPGGASRIELMPRAAKPKGGELKNR